MLIVLCLLSVVAIHRIWHHEDICVSMRKLLPMDPALTPLLIAIVVATVGLTVSHPAVPFALATLACYPVLRLAVWGYQKYDPQPVEEDCPPCKKAEQERQKLTGNLRAWKRRVIVFGAPTDAEFFKLAEMFPETIWIAAVGAEAEIVQPQFSNARYHPIIGGDQLTLINLVQLIMASGNATILTMDNEIHRSRWKLILAMIGTMKAVSWVHVVTDPPRLPPHHTVVAPGQDLAKVLA
jgi:hypothetical protein